MTKAEVYFWALVKGRAIEGVKFRRQFSVGPFILDFYAPSLKLAVEIDGGYHDQPEIRAYDSARENFIAEYGVTFIRFRNEELFSDPDGVVIRLRELVNALLLGLASPP